MKIDVTVVGSSNTDMVVKLPSLPKPGETVLGGRFLQAPGGKGANQAVAAARLGAEVALVARVGNDPLGDQALAGFDRVGINTEYVVRDPGCHSGVALIIVDESGENMIAVASGANAELCPLDLERASPVICRSKVVLLQLETPLESVSHAVRMAREAGAKVILNPAPAQPLPHDLLEMVDILTPNEGEAVSLAGVDLNAPQAVREAGANLCARGVGHVVITRGAKGVLAIQNGCESVIPAPFVRAVDTTAAGDAFNGALACALAQGQILDAALRFAVRVAAISVTSEGAQPSLPSRKKVDGWSW